MKPDFLEFYLGESAKKGAKKEYDKWMEDAREVKKLYKNFEIGEEVKRKEFIKALRSGMSMVSAYRALHLEELMEEARKKAYMDALNSLHAKKREAELGAETGAPAYLKKSAKDLTDDEIEEYLKSVKNGKKISF